MISYLLDINVLIALIDREHVQHDRAHAWFEGRGRTSWATCPITQNGVLRIVGHPSYPNLRLAPAAVADILQGLLALPGHTFWPDDITLLDRSLVQTDRLLLSGQITDSYLLALAMAQGGQFATFDQNVVTHAVIGGKRALHLIV